MATAARRTANYNTLYTTSVERWYNRDKAEEIIFQANPLLQILGAKKEVQAWGADVTVRLLEAKNPTVDSYQYYDTLATNSSKGPQAARFTLSNYNAAVTISDQEMRENREPVKIADRIQFHIDQAELTMADRLNLDAYKGNAAKATNILGLEQAIPAFANLAAHTFGSPTVAWHYKQSTNAYGALTRTAHTGIDNAGGTGWEPLSVDATDATGASTTTQTEFAYDSNGVENNALKELRGLYTFSSQGTVTSDLIISSHQPFADYEVAAATKMQIQKESSAFGSVNLGFDNMKYKNATWIRDERAITQNASDAIGDETNGEQNLYLLNTRFMRFLVDEGMDFQLGGERWPVDQHAFTRHMAFAGQIILINPRYFARMYGYGGTGSL